jgi:hypothetical protein
MLAEKPGDKQECRGVIWSHWHFLKIFVTATVKGDLKEVMFIMTERASVATHHHQNKTRT